MDYLSKPSTPTPWPAAQRSPSETGSRDGDDDDGPDSRSTSPLASTFLSPPPPLRFKPSLNDFVYKSEHFPDEPPEITPTSSALDITIFLIASMLESEENDTALSYLADHQVHTPCPHPVPLPERHRSQLTVTGCSTPVQTAPGA